VYVKVHTLIFNFPEFQNDSLRRVMPLLYRSNQQGA